MITMLSKHYSKNQSFQSKVTEYLGPVRDFQIPFNILFTIIYFKGKSQSLKLHPDTTSHTVVGKPIASKDNIIYVIYKL